MTIYTHITGWGKYIPRTVLTNADLATIVDTSDEWIVAHTGIKERHVAVGDETTCTMAAQAARDALAVAGLTPQDLDLIIVSTSSPDRQLPGAAFIVQSLLGADNAAAFDLRSGCSGFLYSMSTASQFIRNGVYKRALVVGSEVVSRNLNWQDRRTCCLFGDGAGAVILEASETSGGLLYTGLGAQGKDFEALTVKSGGSQYPMCPITVERHWNTVELDGHKTASFAIRTLLRRANEAVTNAGLTWDDIELFIPHQANIRLIEATCEKLGVPLERTFVNVDRYANMSTASLAVALAEAAEQDRVKPGDHVLLVAFGAGLAWATAVIQWGAAVSQQQSGLQRTWRRLRARLTTLTLQARLALYDLNNRLRHKK